MDMEVSEVHVYREVIRGIGMCSWRNMG
jgi:hypothetical protein